MTARKTSLLLPVLILALSSCESCDQPSIVEDALNEVVNLPQGSFQVDPASVVLDENITIARPTNSSAMRVDPGVVNNVAITFSAPKGDVTHAGIRFGQTGNMWLIPISAAKGNKSGTLTFPMQIPKDICDRIKSICHDVACYEFAVASNGNMTYRISKENISEVVLGCAACDVPSCRRLVPDCDCDFKALTQELTEITNQVNENWSDTQFCRWFNDVYIPFFRRYINCLPAMGLDKVSQELYRDSLKDLEETWDLVFGLSC